MLPQFLREQAKQIARERPGINLAIFGPGRGSPYFEKRTQIWKIIREAHPEANIRFYLIDDREPQAVSDEDYAARIYPAEIEQIVTADVILILLTHHRLSALVEFGLLSSLRNPPSDRAIDKCGLAVLNTLEVSRMWFYEARRSMGPGSDRLVSFSTLELESCKVAREIALELFERIILERWGSF